jgi:RNA polymerase sigma factor (sigma-70 family)
MRAVVEYESMFADLHLVADAIGRGLVPVDEVVVVPVAEAGHELLSDAGLLVVGEPAHLHGMSRARTGAGQFRTWLCEYVRADKTRPEPMQASGSAVRQTGPGVTSATAAEPSPDEDLTGIEAKQGSDAIHDDVPADPDAGWTVTALYAAHYRSLVRLAALLVGNMATAQEIVQDSFAALHYDRQPDTDIALSCLRQSVVNRSRSAFWHRVAADTSTPEPAPGTPGAEQHAMTGLDRPAVISALLALPARQREALVLRYYAGLSEAQIAAAMGISNHAVKRHTARAMASLRPGVPGRRRTTRSARSRPRSPSRERTSPRRTPAGQLPKAEGPAGD